MLKDVSIHRLIWIGFDDLKHCQLPFYDVEKKVQLLSTGSYESCVGCRQPEIRRIEL